MKKVLKVVLGLGVGLGLAVGAVVLLRKLSPEVADSITGEGTDLAARLKGALAEGKLAAAATEAELRSKLIEPR